MRARWLQPELWLVAAIPLAALVGGALTLRAAAAGDLSSDGAAEGVRRTAQVQDADLAPDLAAARLGLSARLRVQDGVAQVDLLSSRLATTATPSSLALVHRLRADADRQASLHADGRGRWTAIVMARGSDLRAEAWRVRLEGDVAGVGGAAPTHWRLVGALPRGGGDVLLRPAVAAP